MAGARLIWGVIPRGPQAAPRPKAAPEATEASKGYGMVWYGMVWYGTVRYGMVWHCMVWHGMAWHGMAWHGMAWHGASEQCLTRAISLPRRARFRFPSRTKKQGMSCDTVSFQRSKVERWAQPLGGDGMLRSTAAMVLGLQTFTLETLHDGFARTDRTARLLAGIQISLGFENQKEEIIT